MITLGLVTTLPLGCALLFYFLLLIPVASVEGVVLQVVKMLLAVKADYFLRLLWAYNIVAIVQQLSQLKSSGAPTPPDGSAAGAVDYILQSQALLTICVLAFTNIALLGCSRMYNLCSANKKLEVSLQGLKRQAEALSAQYADTLKQGKAGGPPSESAMKSESPKETGEEGEARKRK
jgi:hypothetical protein